MQLAMTEPVVRNHGRQPGRVGKTRGAAVCLQRLVGRRIYATVPRLEQQVQRAAMNTVLELAFKGEGCVALVTAVLAFQWMISDDDGNVVVHSLRVRNAATSGVSQFSNGADVSDFSTIAWQAKRAVLESRADSGRNGSEVKWPPPVGPKAGWRKRDACSES